jgi:hypothetical protein
MWNAANGIASWIPVVVAWPTSRDEHTRGHRDLLTRKERHRFGATVVRRLFREGRRIGGAVEGRGQRLGVRSRRLGIAAAGEGE